MTDIVLEPKVDKSYATPPPSDPSSSTNPDEVERFLRRWWAQAGGTGRKVEITLRGSKGGPTKASFYDSVETAIAYVKTSSASDVWIGVNPRTGPGPKGRGGIQQVAAITWAMLDIDGIEALPNGILEKVTAVGGMVVASGHGFHLWIPLKMTPNTPENCGRYKAFLLAKAIEWTFPVKSIKQASDVSRLARVPGTVNCKATPVPVRLLGIGENIATTDITGIRIDRSVVDFQVAAEVLRDGGDITDATKAVAEGEKAQEKGPTQGMAYASLTAKNADKAVQTDTVKDPSALRAKRLATRILKMWHFATMRDSEEVLYYKDGIYLDGGEALVEEAVQRFTGRRCTNHLVAEVVGQVRRSTFRDRAEFDSDINVLNLKNGLYDVASGKFTPHTPDYLSLVQFPMAYDLNADCPALKKFFQDVCVDFAAFRDLAVACICAGIPNDRGTMMIGPTGTGKSTTIGILQAFVGEVNRTAVSLQELETRPFAKAELYLKRLNAFADLSRQSMAFTSTFKLLTGGDEITADRKHKGRVKFRNRARLVFSANVPPEIYEDDDAVWKRWHVLKFNQQFLDELGNRDPDILSKLTIPGEMSGLLNEALKAIPLVKAHGLTGTMSIEQTRTVYVKASNPSKAWVEECLEQDCNATTLKREFFEHFKAWALKEGLPISTEDRFFKTLRRTLSPYEEVRTEGEGRPRGVRGWKMKDDVPPTANSEASPTQTRLDNLSSLSNLSTLSPTVENSREDEKWERAEPRSGGGGDIIGKRVDRVDTLDFPSGQTRDMGAVDLLVESFEPEGATLKDIIQESNHRGRTPESVVLELDRLITAGRIIKDANGRMHISTREETG